jgi:hypothetical protein
MALTVKVVVVSYRQSYLTGLLYGAFSITMMLVLLVVEWGGEVVAVRIMFKQTNPPIEDQVVRQTDSDGRENI